MQRHIKLYQKLDHFETNPGNVADHFLSCLYSLRDQHRDLGEGVHSLYLTALVVDVVPRMYEEVRELPCKDDGYSLDQIQSILSGTNHIIPRTCRLQNQGLGGLR